jgi:hypothetical protein
MPLGGDSDYTDFIRNKLQIFEEEYSLGVIACRHLQQFEMLL